MFVAKFRMKSMAVMMAALMAAGALAGCTAASDNPASGDRPAASESGASNDSSAASGEATGGGTSAASDPSQAASEPGSAAPGQSNAAPGKSNAAPGQSNAAPGQSNAAPGKSNAAPGQSNAVPPPSTTFDLKGKTINIGLTVYDARTEQQSVKGKYAVQQRAAIEKAFNCKIKVEQIDWNTYGTKVAAGTSPYDIASLNGPGFYAMFMKNKYLAPIGDYVDINQSHLDAAFIKENYLFNGKAYSVVPTLSGYDAYKDSIAMWFNRRLVNQAGYSPDSLYEMVKNGTWTWDKFEEIAKKVQNLSPMVYGVSNGHFDNNLWTALALSNGADTVTKKSGQLVFNNNDAKFRNALKFWQKLVVTDKCVYTPFDDSQNTMFAQGRIGFQPQYVNRVEQTQYVNMADDYGILPLPKGTEASGYSAAVSWRDGYVILQSNLKGDDANHTYAKAVSAIAAELCKPAIPASEAAKINPIMLESFVRDSGTLDVTFDTLSKNTRMALYYNGLSPIFQQLLYLNGDKLAPVIAGSADVLTVMDANTSAINKELSNTWTF